jgi:hypothetical protein
LSLGECRRSGGFDSNDTCLLSLCDFLEHERQHESCKIAASAEQPMRMSLF